MVGSLSGFRYRKIVGRLKALGFSFERQVAGSHEIWFNKSTRRFTAIPNYPVVMCQKGDITGHSETSRY